MARETIRCEVVDWIYPLQDWDQYLAVVNTAKKIFSNESLDFITGRKFLG
jgi:hypothetical protein